MFSQFISRISTAFSRAFMKSVYHLRLSLSLRLRLQLLLLFWLVRSISSLVGGTGWIVANCHKYDWKSLIPHQEWRYQCRSQATTFINNN